MLCFVTTRWEIDMTENAPPRPVPDRRKFSADRSRLATGKSAAARLAEYEACQASGGQLTPDEQRRADDHLERTAVELGGPIPARFKDLQYLNKALG
jgi:hypothetical protein